jgi:hypothetical protein
MKFRTNLNIESASCKINHQQVISSIGSCFAQSIGQRLQELKFNIEINPFGTIYNPLSIFDLIETIIKNQVDFDDSLIENAGQWRSYRTHSHVFGYQREKLIEKLTNIVVQQHLRLSRTNILIITLGSAFVWKLKSNGKIVANCHKMPAKNFERSLLNGNEISTIGKSLFGQLFQQFPEMNVIVTVSPVRHLRDGLIGNTRSKSALIQATHEWVQSYPQVSYFPAYELLLDDLRDYRYYEKDLVHPSEMAIDYIFEKFIESHCTSNTIELNREILRLRKRIGHRPMHDNDEALQAQLSSLRTEIRTFADAHPYLSYVSELEALKSR